MKLHHLALSSQPLGTVESSSLSGSHSALPGWEYTPRLARQCPAQRLKRHVTCYSGCESQFTIQDGKEIEFHFNLFSIIGRWPFIAERKIISVSSRFSFSCPKAGLKQGSGPVVRTLPREPDRLPGFDWDTSFVHLFPLNLSWCFPYQQAVLKLLVPRWFEWKAIMSPAEVDGFSPKAGLVLILVLMLSHTHRHIHTHQKGTKDLLLTWLRCLGRTGQASQVRLK